MSQRERDLEQRCAKQAGEIEGLRNTIAYLTSLVEVGEFALPKEWRLSKSERKMFRLLCKRDAVSRDGFMAALYDDHKGDDPDNRIINVFICKMQSKLRPFGIEIHKTAWPGPWYLAADVRARFSVPVYSDKAIAA